MSSPAQYRDLLKKLLPPGKIWRASPGSNLDKFMTALGAELSRASERVINLLDERDPRTSTELISDYERLLNLPGDCSTLASTLPERRSDVLARLVSVGGQSIEYFLEVADAAGIDITIDTYPQVMAGATSGVQLTNGPWLYTWRISTTEGTVDYFQVGLDSVGDSLGNISDNQNLQCFFDEIKPAHTFIVYQYVAP